MISASLYDGKLLGNRWIDENSEITKVIGELNELRSKRTRTRGD